MAQRFPRTTHPATREPLVPSDNSNCSMKNPHPFIPQRLAWTCLLGLLLGSTTILVTGCHGLARMVRRSDPTSGYPTDRIGSRQWVDLDTPVTRGQGRSGSRRLQYDVVPRVSLGEGIREGVRDTLCATRGARFSEASIAEPAGSSWSTRSLILPTASSPASKTIWCPKGSSQEWATTTKS